MKVTSNLNKILVLNRKSFIDFFFSASAVGMLVNMQLDNAIKNKQAIRILKKA